MESICDHCANVMPADAAQTCEKCRLTLCERCIGELDHECEDESDE